ncbi:MAG: hypothetical protein IANPNBLG_01925 [Bryobacteraceae bacterium]|nr:hypothetical protein [Bryobacteraceae bacterium]
MKRLFVFVIAASLSAADYPQAEISNGLVKATLNLPNSKKGYYRGTRFDWSGIIFHLESQGHTYFEPFYEKFDPNIRDVDLRNGVYAGPISAVSGPAEEFGNSERSAPGYAEAKPGGTFVKIGVGVLRKPEEPRYDPFRLYEIVDSGRWSVRKGPDWIEFTQELRDPSTGYAYVYRKTVRLPKGEANMVLEHALRNTGTKAIRGNVYNHNFFVIDHQPVGPDFSIAFPFELRGARFQSPLAEARGRRIEYLKVLGNGDVASTAIQGFGDSPRDFDITVENRKTGAGVRVTGDKPLSRVFLWSVKTTLCPEAFIEYSIAPGQETKWNLTYRFYRMGARRP